MLRIGWLQIGYAKVGGRIRIVGDKMWLKRGRACLRFLRLGSDDGWGDVGGIWESFQEARVTGDLRKGPFAILLPEGNRRVRMAEKGASFKEVSYSGIKIGRGEGDQTTGS